MEETQKKKKTKLTKAIHFSGPSQMSKITNEIIFSIRVKEKIFAYSHLDIHKIIVSNKGKTEK